MDYKAIYSSVNFKWSLYRIESWLEKVSYREIWC